MTPYRVDVRRPDGWHTFHIRAASPEMAVSFALRSTHDALEARLSHEQAESAPAPQNDPPTPHRRNNGVSSWGTRYPPDWLPDDYDPASVEVQHGDTWEYRNGAATIVARNAWPPPKPDMSIAWGITEALIEDRTR